MTPTISSPQNERIKAVRRLRMAKERRATGQTLLEGPNLLQAALDAGVVPDAVFVAEGDTAPDVETEMIRVTDKVLDAIATTETPRGPIAVIHIPETSRLQSENTVVLWEVATPGNVGTLLRSAAGFGWSFARYGGADPWSPKVLRAGAGAHFALPMSEVDEVGDLRAAGLTPVATVAAGGVGPDTLQLPGPIALLVGNEAGGLPKEVVAAAEAALTIPVLGLESLNAAVAGSIAMYALSG